MSSEAELISVKSVRCPHCGGDIRVGEDWSPVEALWMHESECAAVVLLEPDEVM